MLIEIGNQFNPLYIDIVSTRAILRYIFWDLWLTSMRFCLF